MPYRIAGDVGVAAVQHVIYSQMGCVFRHQPVADVGIDGTIEILEHERLTGLLVACQVKSGKSYFKEETEFGFIFRTDDAHARYWRGYSLPVLLMLHDPESGKIYWQIVNGETLESTGEMWKILVPKSNVLGGDTKDEILGLIGESEYDSWIAHLTSGRFLMRSISGGESYYLEVDHWKNKSHRRRDFRILDADDREVSTFTYMFPGWEIADALIETLPWASFEIDEDIYEIEEQNQFELAHGIYDRETETYFFDEEGLAQHPRGSAAHSPLR